MCLGSLGSCINGGCSNNPDTACMFKAVFLFLTIWTLTGFNKSKAIGIYQHEKLTLKFPCPYSSFKVGSCSQTFKEQGLKALIHKCNNTKKQYLNQA